MQVSRQSHPPPPVYVADTELRRLRALVADADARWAELLRREIDRAVVLRPDEPPSAFVRLGTVVDYTDLLLNRSARARLSWPEDLHRHGDAVSVASPLGAALLGLRCGDTFGWTDDAGRPRFLVVVGVMNGHDG